MVLKTECEGKMRIKYFKQETNYTCGAAAMRMTLSKFGINKSEKQVCKHLGTNKVRGTWNKSFPEFAEKMKLNYIVRRNSNIKELKKAFLEGFAVIVCYYIPKDKVDHYAVVKKINNQSIILMDSYYGDNLIIKINDFLKNWNSDSRWDKEKRWFFGVKRGK